MTFVCQRWRHLAISLPHLWTDIQLAISDFSSSRRHRYQLWDIQLDRSRSLPLDIRTDLSIGESVPSWAAMETIRACRRALVSGHRCRKLFLLGPRPDGWHLGRGSVRPLNHSKTCTSWTPPGCSCLGNHSRSRHQC
ncbi:hypothetical protein BDV98DRAFT_566146 [Pterulicium gracile]|uniref:F-box domain-containing protein n=1 Tax=Pterulicium gracile TaxID=1884261 RepID=A0A5C3QQQ7_9AGAR|nr:hypothetical protein BDV98DRAFT_566146 [Pterula gracilis]